jgi:hypothetical protein
MSLHESGNIINIETGTRNPGQGVNDESTGD